MTTCTRTINVGFVPFPTDADTDCSSVIDAWAQAGSLLQGFVRWDGASITLDVSDVLTALEAARACEQGGPRSAIDPVLKRWAEHGYAARLVVHVESRSALSAIAFERLIHSTMQHLFLALCLSTRGAGHLNCAHLIDGDSSAPENVFGYYGDPTEGAWCEAEKWSYPPLVRIPFSEAWNWLVKSEFDRCSIAETPAHKALAILLQVSQQFSRVAASDVLLLSQALEALLATGSEKIGSTLKSRIETIFGEPGSHKRWLADFYGIRSRIIHGAFPILRPGRFLDDDQIHEHEKNLLKPIDRVTAVILALLQRLILVGRMRFQFNESFAYAD